MASGHTIQDKIISTCECFHILNHYLFYQTNFIMCHCCRLRWCLLCSVIIRYTYICCVFRRYNTNHQDQNNNAARTITNQYSTNTNNQGKNKRFNEVLQFAYALGAERRRSYSINWVIRVTNWSEDLTWSKLIQSREIT